jgi:uncharacterized membrane protein YdjX (TVP38/TMEM64 family)
VSDKLPVNDRTGSGLLLRWLPLVVFAVVGIGVYASGLHRSLSLENIANNKAAMQAFVAQNQGLSVLIFVVVYIAVTALSIPGALLMTLLGGLLFPFWLGALAVIVAATIGATLLFMVAQSSLGEALRSRGGEAVSRMAEGIRRDAASYLLFLRLVPAFPFALVNLGAAILGVPLKTYIWTTFLGIMPGSLAFVFAATSLGSVLDERKAAFESCKSAQRTDCSFTLDYSTLVSPHLLLAFAALGCVALIPVLARRFLNHSGA